MKQLLKLKPFSLTAIIASVVVMLTADASGSQSPASDAVVLNGVMAIFGDKQAFFQIPGPNPSSTQSFSLVEGQSANGIQLLSVKFKLESVMINNHGHVQSIHICTTPILSAAANLENTAPNAKPTSTTSTNLGAGADSSTDNSGISGDVIFNVGSADLRGSGTAANPNEKSPNSKSPASGHDSNSNPTDSHQYVWWYAEAQKIEKTRLETAQRVMAGEWPPESLTPLTPPGTPAQLIGTSSVFLKNSWE